MIIVYDIYKYKLFFKKSTLKNRTEIFCELITVIALIPWTVDLSTLRDRVRGLTGCIVEEEEGTVMVPP